MSLGTRRILYLVFILAFLIITPSLILYSLGYSLSSGFKLEKSGILVIDTEPEGGKITLNNKPVQNFWNQILKGEKSKISTPTKIKNLKPGDYDVTIEIPGYWPWTKKLTIKPGQTTFAEDIYLFRNDNAVLISEFENGANSFSPDNNFFINFGSSSTDFVNLKKNIVDNYIVEGKATSSDTQVLKHLWSLNSKKVLSGSHIYEPNDLSATLEMKSMLGKELLAFDWNYKNDDEILYLENDNLFSFNTKNKNNKELISGQKVDIFLARDTGLYYLNKGELKKELYSLDSDNKTELILELPNSKYEFLNPGHGYINLKDINNKILYIIDPESKIKPIKEKILDCDISRWVNSSQLLYSNGFEIRLYDINNTENMLLTRLSEQIIGLEWHPSNNYILFATKNSLNILELDNREKHNITKIIDAKNIQHFVLDEKGEVLYFSDEDDNKIKLYKMFIQ